MDVRSLLLLKNKPLKFEIKNFLKKNHTLKARTCSKINQIESFSYSKWTHSLTQQNWRFEVF
jgi:hypothetical protein